MSSMIIISFHKYPVVLSVVAFNIFLFQFMAAQVSTELAGTSTDAAPWFRYINSFNYDQEIFVAVDALLFPEVDGTLSSVYVVHDKSQEQWTTDPSLSDVTVDGSALLSFQNAGLQSNIYMIASGLDLFEEEGAEPGVAYDIVVDLDGNGQLSDGDLIDGWEGAGCYVIRNLTNPGPYETVTATESANQYLTKRIWYPANIASLENLPVVVISHGWTHTYTYYDYLGEHMASYGYVVMAHRNDVGLGNAAGTQTASLSLIANVDDLIANQSTLFGGVLNNKMDTHHMAWIGHSTGGETPVRAYARLRNGENSSPWFTWQDVRLISSICPVAWLSADYTNPFDINYHQFLGGADKDASGFAGDNYYQPLTIFERATGNRQLTYIHGAGHEVFHGFDSSDTWPDSLAQGPGLLSKAQVHPVVKSYFLALCDLYVREHQTTREFFTRAYQDFHPFGIDSSITITNEYRDAHFSPKFVIDDFQSAPQQDEASSGASVLYNTDECYEVLMKDTDGSFAYDTAQPSNGMTRARFDDDPTCVVLAWNGQAYYQYNFEGMQQDFSAWDVLSFRACQLTRHPRNEALDSAIDFTLRLTDAGGNTAELPCASYARIVRNYQRDEGGELHLCLPDGDYSVWVGGTAYPEETFFEIPGYVGYSTTGNYTFAVATEDSCAAVDIYMYDEYGDGWDDGTMVLTNALTDTLAVGTLAFGSGPEPGEGWQNEFVTVRIPLMEFKLEGTGIDLTQITSLAFLFGGTKGVGQGALGLDDVELTGQSTIVSLVEQALPERRLSLRVYPNPATDRIYLEIDDHAQCKGMEVLDVAGQRIAFMDSIPPCWEIPSWLPAGVYAVRCACDGFFVSRSFVVAH